MLLAGIVKTSVVVVCLNPIHTNMNHLLSIIVRMYYYTDDALRFSSKI